MRVDLAFPPENALLSPGEMAAADRVAPEFGVPLATLMDNAGWAVARAARARFAPCRTLVLCGPGNNGGDGYVAARLLSQAGWPVRVAALSAPAPHSLAARAASRWRGPVARFDVAAAARAELAIDAVFGAGLTREISDKVAETLGAARLVLAVDVPSGLDGTTGAARGQVAPAVATVTFFRLKPGHLLLPGRALCGDILLADIGMPEAVLGRIKVSTFANGPAMWRLPRLGLGGHKYSRGHVTVLGGAQMTGAARLVAAASRRTGAGLLTIAASGNADVYRIGEAGVIVSEAGLPELLRDARRRVWVCGPGLGQAAARDSLRTLLDAGRSVVADADALSCHAGDPDALKGASVLTPHAGEFALVFGAVGADRLSQVRAAAQRTGAVVLLKGADTIIAAPDGRVAINASAPPTLATAGAGDVLAGIIAGLLAQGMPPWDAAAAGAWLHGRAAQIAGAGLLAEDIPAALPRAMSEAMEACATTPP